MSVAVSEAWGFLWGYFVFVLFFAFLQAWRAVQPKGVAIRSLINEYTINLRRFKPLSSVPYAAPGGFVGSISVELVVFVAK